MNNLTFEEAVQLFIRDRKCSNLSSHTLDFYKRELLKLSRTLEKQGLSTEPSKITAGLLKKNVIYYLLEEEELKASTINCLLRAARALFNFLFNEKLIVDIENPFDNVGLLKNNKAIVNTFTNEQLFKLLQQPNLNTFSGVRDYTMILLLLETGVRVRELCDISIDDIDWDEMSVKINGKGAKERFVYFQEKMRNQLATYIQSRGEIHHRILFIKRGNLQPIDRRTVHEQIHMYGKKAGITNVRCSPHTMRHTFARLSVQNKANLFALQSILGHSTMNQVLTYVNLFSSEVRDSHKSFSPIENLQYE
ncbi:tyrosine-type recombinase/integrase [Paenibacillus sp. PAMC21692]|uniref:tyrosine-type recombinase/integrase n=1 Tax=Paenibacillus sp. PAMC21692 TaxID=2762320 RepID=UPI0021C3403B|nr:tyrosine-type recombinase/integrase [Paenibacillus sp. PAMC21692]